MNKKHYVLHRRAVLLLLAASAAWTAARHVDACSTLLVGKQATVDGSVLMASSCDGDVMGLIYVMPAECHPPGTKLPMYWNVPRPRNYREYRANVSKGYDLVGSLSVTEMSRSIILGGNVESMTVNLVSKPTRRMDSKKTGLIRLNKIKM